MLVEIHQLEYDSIGMVCGWSYMQPAYWWGIYWDTIVSIWSPVGHTWSRQLARAGYNEKLEQTIRRPLDSQEILNIY